MTNSKTVIALCSCNLAGKQGKWWEGLKAGMIRGFSRLSRVEGQISNKGPYWWRSLWWWRALWWWQGRLR